MKKYSFGYNQKIRLASDFTSLFKHNKKIVSDTFIVFVCPNNLEYNRLAISIKRHVANAVKRNRMKRLVREIFRLNQDLMFFENKNDILVIARKDFSEYKYESINEELLKQWQKLSQS